MSDEAWVTLATTDGYAVGAFVLAHSLRRVRTTRKLHCMIIPNISAPLRDKLNSVFDEVSEVDIFDSGDESNLCLIGRPELGITFTKINCWKLTQYKKCVFLDADCLVLQNCDELFEHDELSAVADIGWPDCFNSGVFVYTPSIENYSKLLNYALEHGSFDGGDQGLLNIFYAGWRDKSAEYRLPFIYNMTSGAVYTYAAAYQKYGATVKIVHFIGSTKPWQRANSVHFSEHHSYWNALFVEHFMRKSSPSNVSSQSSTSINTDRAVLPHTVPACDFPSLLLDMNLCSNCVDPVLINLASTSTDTVSNSATDDITSLYNDDGPSRAGEACMRVFRCTPPLSWGNNWKTLQHRPVALSRQIAALSREMPASELLSSLLTDEERLRAWEVGYPDYMGADSFENIQKAIDKALK